MLKLAAIVLFSFLLSKCGYHNNYKCDGNCENGFGTENWSDGGYEKGHWKNGKLTGHGSQFFGSTSQFAGDTYEGNFDSTGYCGLGTYRSKRQDGVQSGQWKNGKPNGYSKLRFGPFAEHPNRCFEGEWKDGVYNGFGKLNCGENGKYAGCTYVGNYRNGLMDGIGTFHYADGSYYTGKWYLGNYEGEGTYVFADSSRYHGFWVQGYNEEFESLKSQKQKTPIHK